LFLSSNAEYLSLQTIVTKPDTEYKSNRPRFPPADAPVMQTEYGKLQTPLLPAGKKIFALEYFLVKYSIQK
jgi:hypothetical protein